MWITKKGLDKNMSKFKQRKCEKNSQIVGLTLKSTGFCNLTVNL